MHLRMRLMKLQSKFCQKSSKQNFEKNPGRVATGKKLAERTGVAREAKKKNIRSSCWAKRERQRRSQRIFASWHRRPGCLRSGRLLSAKGETRLPAKLGHLSLNQWTIFTLGAIEEMFRPPRVDKKMKSSPFRPNAYRRLAYEEEEEEEEEE